LQEQKSEKVERLKSKRGREKYCKRPIGGVRPFIAQKSPDRAETAQTAQ